MHAALPVARLSRHATEVECRDILPYGYMSLQHGDVIEGLVKPIFSGFIIATVGCYYGLKTPEEREALVNLLRRRW